MKTVTPEMTNEAIQRILDEGGEITFAPGTYENAHYRLSSGTRLWGKGALLAGGAVIRWKKRADGVLECDAPAEKPIRSLTVAGGLRQRCRFPETGYAKHRSVFDAKWLSSEEGGWDKKPTEEDYMHMFVAPEDIAGFTMDAAEVTLLHSWDESMLTVASVKGDEILFTAPAFYPAGGFGVKDYCLWNIPETFTVPGTFYHDVKAGKLYYRPLPGEDENTLAFLPHYPSAIYAEEIRDVTVRDFSLTACADVPEANGCGALRAPGAVDFAVAHNVRLSGLRVYASAGNGIRFRDAAFCTTVERCECTDMGAGGILAFYKGEYREKLAAAEYTRIENNRIDGVGRYFSSAYGIGFACCHVRHNEVSHTSYNGILGGGDGNIIEYNIVHDCMEVLNDGGALYVAGGHGCVIRHNLVWGVRTTEAHPQRHGYYMDEWAIDYLVEGNVALFCDYPVLNHRCGGHTYRDNIFCNDRDILISTLVHKAPLVWQDNVISSGGKITFRMARDCMKTFSRNRWFSADGGMTLDVFENKASQWEQPYTPGGDNAPTDRCAFSVLDRVFVSGDLTLDLSAAGIEK